MGVLDLFRGNSAVSRVANGSEIISRYKHLRMVNQSLNNKMVAQLSKDVLHEGGRKLGILRRGILVFDSEDESAVLMDYCLYDVRRQKCNAVEKYLIDSPPDPESDEMACLRAMQQAFYALFVVDSAERGLGVTGRDLLSDSPETLLVADLGLGSSAKPGLVIASRLLPHDGFFTTGGAALPMLALPKNAQDQVAKEFRSTFKRNKDGYFDPAPVIRACLSRGASSRVRYQDVMGSEVGPQRLSSSGGSITVGRNAPCPCGSGKKFKQCCLKK